MDVGGFLLSVILVDTLVVGPLTAWLADERGRDPLRGLCWERYLAQLPL